MPTLEAGQKIAVSRILFATDFSPYSDTALPYAAAIARKYGAKVYGTHVVSSEDYLFTTPDVWPAHLEKGDELQQEITARIEEQLRGLPHEVLFGAGDVWSVLSRQIQENNIELVVLGTHGRTGARKMLVGSVAEKVFRQSPCPVLSIGPNVPWRIDGDICFENILLATDFGKESLAALPFALSLAEEGKTRLTLLHVAEVPTSAEADLERLRASLKRRLTDSVPPEAEERCSVECIVEFRRTFVSPAEQILEMARNREVDLIVLGVRPPHGGMGAITHLAHTTDQHIVAHAMCPVLTVRG